MKRLLLLLMTLALLSSSAFAQDSPGKFAIGVSATIIDGKITDGLKLEMSPLIPVYDAIGAYWLPVTAQYNTIGVAGVGTGMIARVAYWPRFKGSLFIGGTVVPYEATVGDSVTANHTGWASLLAILSTEWGKTSPFAKLQFESIFKNSSQAEVQPGRPKSSISLMVGLCL